MEVAGARERPHDGEPLSPELVLVDPSVRVLARRELPEPGGWRPATVPPPTPPAAGRFVDTPEPARPYAVVHIEREKARTSRRLLAVFAAALVTPFVAASGFSLAVVAYSESEGSLLPHEAIAPADEVGSAAPGPATAVTPNRSQAARVPRRRAHPRVGLGHAVRVSNDGVVIGAWPLEREATVAAATAVFGRPTRRRRDAFHCDLTWRRLGLRVTFYDIDARRPCRRGVFVQAAIDGRSWRTARGLRIGAPAASIGRLHPAASRRSKSWWLLTPIMRTTFQPWRPDPWLRARVRDGRVVAFYIT